MRYLEGLVSYLSSSGVLVAASSSGRCKCTPGDSCWPSAREWSSLNKTLAGHLVQGVPPASVCYPSQPNYNEEQCAFVRSQWFNSTWHAEDPISVDYPIWANNSCNPIYPNGTSVTGVVEAGEKGCTIGNYPVYAVNAQSATHVSAALKWAAKKNVRVVVKGTGHSYPGRSVGYGSLSIWTHNFRGIDYVEAFEPKSCPVKTPLNAVRIAAGHTGVEVQADLAKRNVIIVTGGNPDVGIVGWLTGGGHGTLSTSYGMGADNLLEATIVTPDGKVHVANPCKNSDLFFAIRGGGGGTFGVVLEVVVKAYPSPRTTIQVFSLGSLSSNITTEFWEMAGFIHSEMPKLKAGGMQGYYYMVGPPSFPTLSFLWVFFLYDKPNGTVERLMAPIEEYLGQRPTLFAYQYNVSHSPNYFDLYGPTFTNEQVANGGSAYGSRLLSPESLSDPNVTAEVFASIGANPLGNNGVYGNPALLGHMIASPNQPSYYPDVISMNPGWRDTLTHFLVVEGWRDGMTPAQIRPVYEDITNKKVEPLRGLSPDTGAYFNECDSYEPEWQKAFWGKHYPRLKRIKQKYDPKNVLWCRRCVGSEALVEQANGRLCKAEYGKKRGGTVQETEKRFTGGSTQGASGAPSLSEKSEKAAEISNSYKRSRGGPVAGGDVSEKREHFWWGDGTKRSKVVHAPHTGDHTRFSPRDDYLAARGMVKAPTMVKTATSVSDTITGDGDKPKISNRRNQTPSFDSKVERTEDHDGGKKLKRKESGWNREVHDESWGADWPDGMKGGREGRRDASNDIGRRKPVIGEVGNSGFKTGGDEEDMERAN